MKTKIKNITLRHGLFLAFAFAMTATLSFLAIHNMTKTDAASFQAGDIISDAVMANYNSMSESDINNFMHSKNSCNDTNLSKANKYIAQGYTYQIKNGHFVCLADQTFNGQSAAHIIYRAAQDYRINPQVLLVLLQKEQSLITDTWPNDRQIRKATGFACTDSAPCDESKSGFENQIRKAANLYRTVLDGGWTNYPVGNNYVQYNPNTGCGGTTIYIANRATSSLYRYTPYQPNATALNGGGDSCSAYGNLNFWKYFTSWFGDTHAIADIKSVYMPEGTYILNTTAGKALGFSSTENGAAAKVVNSNNSDTSQQFTLERDDYQYFKLRNVASGRYLDVAGADTVNGTKVQVWDGNDTCAQKWSIEIVNEKSYKLRNACSYKSLDINGAAVNSNGAKIQIWDTNGTNAQQWVLTNLSSAPLDNDIYNITTTSNKALALTTENTSNGTKVVTGELHSAITERFQITRSTDGFYRIKNIAANRFLDVNGAGKTDGTTVQIWDSNTSCAQRWAIQKNGSGYRLFSACSGKSLDVSSAAINVNNSKIQIWTSNNTSAQVWLFKKPVDRTIPDGFYNIESELDSKLRIDADGGSLSHDGTNIQVWSKNGNNSQKFQISYDTQKGYYNIVNISTHRNLDVKNASTTKEANIHVWEANNTCAQHWMIMPTHDNYYKILSACSRLALDVQGASTRDGTNIQTYLNNNTKAQNWKFVPTSISTIIPEDEKIYTIESTLNNKIALDVAGASNFNGANVQVYQKNDTNAQKWKFKKVANYYQLINIATNRVLDVSAAGFSNGTNIQIWQNNNTCAQKWRIETIYNEYFTFISACNNKTLDVSGGKTKNGTNVQIWQSNNTDAQRWRLIGQ